MSKAEILIVDDEHQIRKLLEITLEAHDYKVTQAATAKEALQMAAVHPPQLILLDLGLPDKNGLELLKDFRLWYNRPIIILSVANSEQTIIEALDNGATDYLTKPFRPGELLARIRAVLRRSQSEPAEPALVSGSIIIDFAARVVKQNGKNVKLTATEYNLLALLAVNEGRVLTHQFILKEVWGVGYQTETQYLRVFIAQLRKKLEEDPNRPKRIITESGIGYRFV
jgi:two-component system, OmpR family, KDP operon response regulator KdpE